MPVACRTRRGFSAEKRIRMLKSLMQLVGPNFLHEDGFERRLLATCQWHVATAVAFPQKSESVLPQSQISPEFL